MTQYTVTQVEEKRKNNESIVLVDGRSREDFAISAIPGAMHIPFAEFGKHLEKLAGYDEVIVYCNT